MKNVKNLYVGAHREVALEDTHFKVLGYFFDIKSGVGVHKEYIECDLEVGNLYDFIYEDRNDTDTCCYAVLKREGNVYYIAEYYREEFYRYVESGLGDCWVKCDVKEELGIDLEEWGTKKIHSLALPDMREKVKEYVVELEVEIERCTKLVEDRMEEFKDSPAIALFTSSTGYARMMSRVQTLTEVMDDLRSRLDEMI